MSGDALTIGLVLFAALLHASWNAFAKGSSDPLLAMWLMTMSAGLLYAGLAPVVSFPRAEAWPYLAGSLVLHFAYQLFLVAAYRTGDLSQVYPVARGLGPCVVALLAGISGEERVGSQQLLGLALVWVSLASLTFSGGTTRRPAGRALRSAVLTGLMIGGYTFVDARGVRLCDQARDFIVWSMLLDAVPITVTALVVRRGHIRRFLGRELRRGVGGGLMAGVAYGIVLFAMSTHSMASIAALRETSVLFAAWIGTRLLGEPFGAPRMIAAAGVASGIALLQT